MKKHDPGKRLIGVVCLFYFSAFMLLALKDMNSEGFIMAVAVPLLIMAGTGFLNRFFATDRLFLVLIHFLCALGVLVLYSTNPEMAMRQAVFYGIGTLAMVLSIYIIRLIRNWQIPAALMIPVSIVLLALPLIQGRETNGATNWIYLGGMSFQPSEAVKLALLVSNSWFMSRRKLLPWLMSTGALLLLLMLQKDLGTALMYYGTTLFMFFAAQGSLILTGLGLAGGGVAAVVGYLRFAHVKKRVAIWRNPWIDYKNAGYQIVQGLIALASGGMIGVGLGLGNPTEIPVYHTDYIFAVICEQFGLIFGLCVLAIYVAIIWRGATTAMAARRSFHALLATGCTVILALQTFTIIGGVVKMIPLTGVTMPFVSYGGTSLVTSMCIAGFMQGVASLNDDDLAQDTHIAMMGGELLS